MAERRFTVRLDAEMNIGQVKTAVQNMQTELSKLNLPQDVGSKLTGTFDKLTGEIERFQAMSAKGIGSSKDFTQLERSGDKILQLYAQLRNQISGLDGMSNSQLSKLIPPSALANIKRAQDAFKTYKAEIERSQGSIQKHQGAIKSLEGEISGLEKEMSRVQKMNVVGNTTELNKMGKEVATAKNELDGLEQEAQQVKDKMAQMEATMASPRKSSKYRDLQSQLEGLGPKIEQARNNYQNLQTQFANTTTVQKQTNMLKTLGTDLEGARGKLTTMNQELANMQANDSSQALLNLVNALNQIPGINIDPTTASLEQIQQVINNLSQGEINKLKTSFSQAGQQVNSAKGQFDQFGQQIDTTRNKVRQMDSQMGEVDMLKSRISYFFGLTNSVYLLRRALTSAMETVKELDQTMTEAAVVTDFSVDDMWNKLPEYTEKASELGATINDLYSATTLYYQQGLKTNEAMKLGAETMKMARIAGMEASEATEAMTAALRGFNMELNEASAVRVNDVYSKLAAVTASDTEQIATAMTKTASIAHSANMEFETTAALLAQIIETTQEAPETAGTAMKTIIARFSEVKELKSQGKLKGEDEDGEEIDVNKIQTALRSVGISMEEYFNGTEGLDDVLLRLAEKWDDLDFKTQRYIATMAAGSRQQSRFIAMMSDYKRTVELVGEANDSAGASQKQFEKTLDSIKTKLNQLKNQWDRFTMGLADNELIKMGIDILTAVLKVINDITDGISGENGLLKSVINLAAAFGALKLGGWLLTKGIGLFLGIDTKGISGEKAEQDLKQGGKQAKKSLIEGAEKAASTLVSGAKKASQTEQAGAQKETATEQAGAKAEVATEQAGAKTEVVIEQTGAQGEAVIEKAGAKTKVATEQAGAKTKVATEQAGAVQEVSTEQAGAVQEASTEQAGAVQEVATEQTGAVQEVITEQTGATTEAATEQAGAVAEVATEQAGAVAEVATEQAGAIIEVATEQVGTVAQVATEQAGTTAKVATEQAGALERVATEQAGATTEVATEQAGAVQEVSIEYTGSSAGALLEQQAAVAEGNIEIQTAMIKRAIETGQTGSNMMQMLGPANGYFTGNGFTVGGQAQGAIGGGQTPLMLGDGMQRAPNDLPTKQGFFQKHGKKMANVAGILVAAAVVGAIANAAEKGIEEIETAGEKLEELGKTEEILIEQSENLSKELSNFSQNRNEMDKMVDSLKTLKRGSAEWASTLHNVRTKMNDILSTYPELKKYTQTMNGITTLTDEGWAEYERQTMEAYYDSQVALYTNRIAQIEYEKITAAENLNLATNTITQKEKEEMQSGAKTGTIIGGVALGAAGYIGGTALGAKVGGALGTIIGPLGTILGAALGAAIGLGIGYLVGGGATASQGVAPEVINSVAEYAITYDSNPNSDANEIGFIAETSTPEEVDAFLEAAGVAEEDMVLLSTYIVQNAQEFDAHTRAMAYATERLNEYGKSIGQTEAERRGYGNVAEGYSDISEYVYGRDWTNELANQKSQLMAETDGKVTQKEIDIVLEYSTVYEKYDPYANDGEGGFIRKDNGEATKLTDEQILDIVAQKRTADVLNDRVEKTYNLFDGAGNPDVYGALLTAESTDDLANKLTYNELMDQDVRNQINKEKGLLQNLENSGITNEREAAQQAQLAGYDIGYSVTYTQKAVDDELVNVPTGKFETTPGHYAATKRNDKGLTYEYDETLTKKISNDYLGQGLSKEEMAGKYHEGYYTYENGVGLIDDYAHYTQNTARNVSESYNVENTYKYMLDTYGLNEEEARSYFAGELGSEEKYNMTHVNALETELTTANASGDAIFGENGRLNYLADANIAVVQQLFSDINALAQLKGIDAKTYFYDPLETIYGSMEGMTEDAKERVLSLFAQADPTDLSDLKSTEQLVNSYSDVNDATKQAFSDWVDGLEEAGIAVANIDLETLTKQLESLFGVLKKIESTDLGEATIFSQEEMDAMVSSSEKIDRDDFYATTEGFVYLGNSMNDLRDTIMESNRILLGQQTQALMKKVKTGEIIEKDPDGLGKLNWETVSSWGPAQIQEFYKKAVDNIMKERGIENVSDVWDPNKTDLTGTLLEGTNINLIKDMYTSNSPSTVMDNYGLTVEQFVYGSLGEIADSYLGLAGAGGYREQLTTGLTTLKEQNLSLMTGQEMIDMIGTKGQYGEEYTKEDIDKALMAQAEVEGTSVAGYELGQQIYQESGGDQLATEEERNAAWEEAHRLGQALALDATRNQKEYTKLIGVFDAQTEAVKSSNRGTDTYRKGLSKIKKAMEDVYDIELSEQFMLDNAELLERVLAGEEGAWEEWVDKMTSYTAEALNKNSSIVSGSMAALALDVDNIADTIDPNIGITSTFDPAGIIAAKIGLQTIGEDVVATQAQLDGLTSLYDILGATIEYETETKWLKDGALFDTDPGGGQQVQVVKAIHVTNTGSGGLSDYSPSGGGGGGGSEPWENPYDEFYNTVEKINEELRKREKLELRYQRLLDRNAATAAEIARLTREQIASLRTERDDREGLLRNRERQMRDIESEYSDVGKYAWYNEEKGQIEIDWNLLEGLDGSTDEDLTSRVEEYISKLEEQQDLIEEEQDALQEIQDAIWELYEQGKDEYFDLEDQVKEAIIADRQKEIDKLSEINDSINDTNSKLLESMQEQLDEYRQNRDNEKTEEELSDKQRKLAYLQQDTSGANALEIMQLQEELDEATEDYTDTLIDQKISELQQQNDKAAEQRQQQIDIMQAQLDQYSESAAIWDEVNALMSDGLDPESGLIRGSRLEELLKSAEGFDGMSKLKKMDWLNELNNNVAQALAWLEGGALQNLFGEGGKVTFTDKDGNTVTGTINENGDVETDDGRIYSGDKFKIDQNGNIVSYETEDEAKENWNAAQPPEETEDDWPSGLIKPSQIEGNVYSGMSGTKVKSVQTALKKLGYDTGTIDSKFGPKTKAAVKKFQKDAKTEGWNPDIGSPDGVVGPRTKLAFKNHPKQFKTGGLADFTGPAWLDGTKSKPEYVLNADQTKAFFTLVDVLGGLESKAFATPEKTGDNTYDIDINVESIGSDYDVEQLATTVKRLINEDARYRNNNTINLTR